MRLWLESNPLEVIIVTVKRDEDRVRKLLEPLEAYSDKIIVLLAPFANKRQQLMVGVDAAKGKILALVDDDVYWREKGVVPYLLAPFENDKVGAVAGIQRLVNIIHTTQVFLFLIQPVPKSPSSVKIHESSHHGRPPPHMTYSCGKARERCILQLMVDVGAYRPELCLSGRPFYKIQTLLKHTRTRSLAEGLSILPTM